MNSASHIDIGLPELFIRQMSELLDEERLHQLLRGLEEEPLTSIRVNTDKANVVPPHGEQVPWCCHGYYLPERPSFTFDPLFHAGCYYVQEAASMFLYHLLTQYVDKPVRMLDMCAAPGGKTTTAIDALPKGSVVVCNEPIRLRAQILCENIWKWGSGHVLVTNCYPKDYARSGLSFDVILCDVPCSGEGMFRKDKEAVAQWSPQLVENCQRLQREIVSDAWRCLRPGGLLVYSTCTMNTREDEENVRWICEELGGELLPVAVAEEWNISSSLLSGFDGDVYRFLPGFTRGEGLFMALLRKGESSSSETRGRKKAKGASKGHAASMPRQVLQWLKPAEDYQLMQHEDVFYAVPTMLQDDAQTAAAQLRLLSAGIPMGQMKGRDFLPHHALALSTVLSSDVFPRVDLNHNEAIAYLRRESVCLPADTPKGHVLLTYQQKPLGFVKNLGNRANNLYPQEWRIKNTSTPHREQTVVIG